MRRGIALLATGTLSLIGIGAGPVTEAPAPADPELALPTPALDGLVASQVEKRYVRQNRSQGRQLRRLQKRVAYLQAMLDHQRFIQSCTTPVSLIRLGRCLISRGLRVSEHPAFGGVEPVHAPGSCHYRSRAIDVNADSNEYGRLSALVPYLEKIPQVTQVFWQVPGHYDHLHVSWLCGS